MDTFWSMSSDTWRFRLYLLFLLLLIHTQTTDAQMNNNCNNNCGNNCGCGCGVQFPDPPPIILQPPAPPPNNTCCCDCANGGNGGNGNNAFNGNCGGCGSNCGNTGGSGDCCCGCGGNNGCCCGGGGNNGYNCCNPGPLTNQNPNTPGGPQSRTNRCCQVICSKPCCCCGNGAGNSGGGCGGSNCGGGGGNGCCQPCCCQPCCCGNGGGGNGECCCTPCCGQLCNSCCFPSCCNPCSCYDCCNDCYPCNFDCEIGYKRRRRKRQIFPTPAGFHRFRSYPRRFYVLPLPLPQAHEDMPPRTRQNGRRPHTHHHFHHHFFHCCPCSCCCNGGQNNFNGQQNSFNANNFDSPCAGNSQPSQFDVPCAGNSQPSQFDNPSQQWQQQQPVFGPQQDGCFGAACNQPPIEPPCVSNNNYAQQDFYGNGFGGINYNGNFNNRYNDCPGCQYSGGYRRFQRLLQRRKRQLVSPAFNGDKVLNFLIPMFYKKPTVDEKSSTKCPTNKRTSRSYPCSILPTQNPNDFPSPPHHQFNNPQPCSHQMPNLNNINNMNNMNRDEQTKCCCQCCTCASNKKRRRKRKKK